MGTWARKSSHTLLLSVTRILQASFISVTTLMSGLILNFFLPLQI